MREINNNTANSAKLNFAGIQPAPKENENSQQTMPQTTETTDLSKMPSDVIGRSQVEKPSIEKDMKFLTENPKTVEKANKMFDSLISKGYTYEQATELINAAIKEFNL